MNAKKWAIALSAVLGVLLIAAVALPPLLNVDRYRPALVEKANSQIRGKLSLGKLKLSLWGRIRVEVGGLELSDSKGRKVLAVQDASFLLPFSSILAGSPRLTLVLNRPEIGVVRETTGEWNVLSLMKPRQPTDEEDRSGKAAPSSSSSGGSVEVPAIVARARLGVDVREGALLVRDEASKSESRINHLRVELKDASITEPTDLSVEAELDTRWGDALTLKGPVKLEAKTTPKVSGGEMKQLTLALDASGSDLSIVLPGLFEKKKGVPLTLSGVVSASAEVAKIESLKARFHQAELQLKGEVDQLSTSPRVKMQLASNAISLQGWDELIPMLKAYDPSGSVGLDFSVDGPVSSLRYQGDLKLEDLGFRHALLKASPKINGKIHVSTNQLEAIQLRLSAPGTDLAVQGQLIDFIRPKLTLNISSQSCDLDQWVVFAKKSDQRDSQEKAAGSASSPAGQSASDYDALIEPLRKNAVASALEGKLGLTVQKFQAHGFALSDLKAQVTMKNLLIGLDSASLGIFSGRVAAQGKVDLKPAAPVYSFNASVEGLQIEKAVEAQMALFKNTLVGKLHAEVSGSGASFNPEKAVQGLNLKGSFDVKKARFATLDVAKMAVAGINQAVAKAAEKIPALRGRQVGLHSAPESVYEVIRSSFQMSQGKFSAPDFQAKAEPQRGIDLSGRLELELKSLGLKAQFELVDTYNLTKAQDLSVDVAGVTVPHVLAEKGKPVRIPVSVGCQLNQPCPNYGELPEHFAKVALANLSGVAQQKVKDEAAKKVGEALKKALPGGLNRFFR